MNTELIQPESIPAEVREAAQLVSTWMKANGHEKWELLDVCSRQFAHELNHRILELDCERAKLLLQTKSNDWQAKVLALAEAILQDKPEWQAYLAQKWAIK